MNGKIIACIAAALIIGLAVGGIVGALLSSTGGKALRSRDMGPEVSFDKSHISGFYAHTVCLPRWKQLYPTETPVECYAQHVDWGLAGQDGRVECICYYWG